MYVESVYMHMYNFIFVPVIENFQVEWFVPLYGPYRGVRGAAVTPATKEINTIIPFPDAFNRGCASLDRWKTDSKFVLLRVDMSSAVVFSASFGTATAALLTWTKFSRYIPKPDLLKIQSTGIWGPLSRAKTCNLFIETESDCILRVTLLSS